MKIATVKKKKIEVGTEGNEIVPVAGEVIETDEEQSAQFEQDFGDVVGKLLDDSVIEDGYDDTNVVVEQVNEHGETVRVTPDAQLIGEQPEPDEVETTPSQTVRRKPDPVKKEEPTTVDLDNYVDKVTHDKVVKDYNLLQGEFSKLKESANAGILNISDDDLSVLRRIKYDYESTPLGMIVEKYYKGELDVAQMVPQAKAPHTFMPEGDEFDATEAYTPGTSSFQAREKYEGDKMNLQSEFKKAGTYINSMKQNTRTNEELETESLKLKEKLMGELIQKVPQAKKYQDTFVKWLDKQDNIYLLSWVAFSQSVNNTIKNNKNIKNSPKPNVSSIISTDSPIVINDQADQDMYDEFGTE